MEVRAYGLLLRDVVDRCDEDGVTPGSTAAAIATQVMSALREAAERCVDLAPAQRPSFAVLRHELAVLRYNLYGR